MTEYRTCHICHNLVEEKKACPTCTEWVETLPHPNTMTGAERIEELEMWGGTQEIEFKIMHRRISALVGRTVYTHEFRESNWPTLLAEAGSNYLLTEEEAFEKTLDAAPENMTFTVITTDEEEDE